MPAPTRPKWIAGLLLAASACAWLAGCGGSRPATGVEAGPPESSVIAEEVAPPTKPGTPKGR